MSTSPSHQPVITTAREMMRHSLATLAYRANRALAGAPAGFSETTIAGRTPGEILAHLCDLIDWTITQCTGKPWWKPSEVGAWDDDVARFFQSLEKLDRILGSDAELCNPAERMFQGPIADALTHVGQIAMIRRMSGAPTKGENFFVAEITVGRVGQDQAEPKKTF